MPSADTGHPAPRHRALKAVVIGLGLLLLLAFAGLVGTIVYRLTHPSERASSAVSGEPGSGFGDLRQSLPEGWRLAGTEVGDGKLVVRLERIDGPGGRVMIFDLETGAGLGTIDFQPPP